MTIIDDRTPNLNLTLPNKDNALEDDAERLRGALTTLDTVVSAKANTSDLLTKADLVAGKVPAIQLPSFVDDVVEAQNFASLPTTGETGKIYVTLNDNKSFRWGGSAYIEISPSPGSTDSVPEGAVNKYFTPARALSAIPNADNATFGLVKIGAGLGIGGDGALFAAAAAGSAMTIQEINPASNGASSVTVPGGYVAGTILVAFNGSFLAPSDFTAANGTTINFVGFTANTTDTVIVCKLATIEIGNLPAGSVGTSQLADLGVTEAKIAAAFLATIARLGTAQNFTAPQRSAILTDNDGSFDLAAKQNFKCTTSGALTLTFANQQDGLSGSVIFINSGNHTVSAHANTKISANDLAKLSVSGTYRIDYLSDGTNAYCSVAGAF